MQVMKERRAAQAGSGAVADDEAEDEPDAAPSAATLSEDLHSLEGAYSAWHLALEQLWR